MKRKLCATAQLIIKNLKTTFELVASEKEDEEKMRHYVAFKALLV